MAEIKRLLTKLREKTEQHDQKLAELKRRQERGEERLRFIEQQTKVMRRR